VLYDIRFRFRALFKRTAVDRETDDELRFHLEQQVASYEAAGMRRDEALRRARLEFGGLAQVKEECGDALGVRVLENLARQPPPVAIVNEAFTRRFGIGPNPVGRVILTTQSRATPDGEQETNVRVEIVGLAADAVYMRPRDPIPPTMYVPLGQEGDTYPFVELSIRTAREVPSAVAPSVVAAIANVNPDLVLTFQPVEDLVSATLTQERLLAILSGFFGAIALLLAGLGLYGVTAYSVTRRRAEIGIRMALGAAPLGVIRLVLARVLGLVALGVITGLVVTAWASRYVATLLYGLEPHDMPTLAGAAVVLAAVAAVAGYLPARRAARIDPAMVLRDS
jgi:hypothetical protein